MADLDDRLDELYGLPLADFTRRRNELVKEAKASGDQAAADALAELRKPSVGVWAINQLARRNRRELDLLLDSGHRLREGQRSVLAGEGREALEAAEGQQEEALRGLLGEAKALLASEHGAATEQTLDRIRTTLRTAAVDDTAREALARGRLQEELEPSGFAAVAALVDTGARRPSAKSKRGRSDHAERLAAARKALDSAKAAEREASKRAHEAARGAEAAEREWKQAKAAADKAQAAQEAAAEQRAQAEEQLNELRRPSQ